MREVHRVLRPDGVFFINVGDSWSSGGARSEQKHDTVDTGLSSCQDYGQFSESPCGGCVSLFVDRISGSGDGLVSRYQNVDGLSSLLRMVAGKLRSHISGSSPRVVRSGDDSPRLCSSLDTLVVSALDALVSTSLLSSVLFQAEYLRMDSLSSCLSATFSAFRESLQCEHKMACPFLSHLIDGGVQVNVASERSRYGTSLTGGALGYRIWGRVFDLLSHRYSTTRPHHLSSIKPLDMVLIPEQLALAARADGWYVRSVLIWAKGVSLSDEYNGNPMPESLNGWRFEKCKVKVRSRGESVAGVDKYEQMGSGNPHAGRDGYEAVWQACPGCPKCEKNGGYVLRKGSWRPTKAYEQVLMLTKTDSYFCDREAVLERGVYPAGEYRAGGSGHKSLEAGSRTTEGLHNKDWVGNGGRNLRSVLLIPTVGSKIKHFAIYPPRLIEPLIKASTSEKGCCPKCGAPYARVIDKGFTAHDGDTATEYAEGTNANRLALLRQAARQRGTEYGRLSYNSKYKEGGVTGLATQGFQRNKTIEAERECSREDAKLLYPNDERAQQDYINHIHDHGGLDKGRTVGWLPTCSCENTGDPVPCRVLDPFSGAGTTSLVCERLGLDSIGIDTSAEYIKLSEDRLAEDEQKRIDEQIKQLKREAKGVK